MMGPKGLPPRDRMVENILRVYYEANDLEKLNGRRWYRDARAITQQLALRYNVTVDQAAAVISILSPQNEWSRNVSDADTLLAEWNAGAGPDDFTVSTYTSNRRKAWHMLEERSDPFEMFGKRAPKTRVFFKLLSKAGPDYDDVVIDGHAYSIAMGVRHPLSSPDIPGLEYRDRYGLISAAYREAAKRVELRPEQMQAITWLTWKRLHGV